MTNRVQSGSPYVEIRQAMPSSLAQPNYFVTIILQQS